MDDTSKPDEQALLEFLAGPLQCLRCGSAAIAHQMYDTQEDHCAACSETASREGMYRELVWLRNQLVGLRARVARLEYEVEELNER